MRLAHILISVTFAFGGLQTGGMLACGTSSTTSSGAGGSATSSGAGGSATSSGAGGSATSSGAGGSTGAVPGDLTTVLPANNQIAGWTADPDDPWAHGTTKVYTTVAAAVADIDGTADHFWTDGHTPKAVAFNAYLDGDMALKVYLVQMTSAADGDKIYNEFVTNSDYPSPPYAAVEVGDKGWISCERDGCILVAKKGPAFIREQLNYATDLTVARAAVLAFATEMFKKF